MKYVIDVLGTKYPDRVLLVRDLLNSLLDQVEFGMKNFEIGRASCRERV